MLRKRVYVYIYIRPAYGQTFGLRKEKGGDTCDTREYYGNFRLGSWHKDISSSLLPVSLRRQRWRIPFRQFSQYRIEYVNFGGGGDFFPFFRSSTEERENEERGGGVRCSKMRR